MHACIHTYIHTYIYTHTYIHSFIHTYIHTYIQREAANRESWDRREGWRDGGTVRKLSSLHKMKPEAARVRSAGQGGAEWGKEAYI